MKNTQNTKSEPALADKVYKSRFKFEDEVETQKEKQTDSQIIKSKSARYLDINSHRKRETQ